MKMGKKGSIYSMFSKIGRVFLGGALHPGQK
jgi:hypothetical protein